MCIRDRPLAMPRASIFLPGIYSIFRSSIFFSSSNLFDALPQGQQHADDDHAGNGEQKEHQDVYKRQL